MGQTQLKSFVENGNEVHRWKLVQISSGMSVDPITTDGAGAYSGFMTITNAMCSRFTQLAGIYGKVRIHSLRFIFVPIQGVTTAGQSIAYIDYNGTAPVATLALASLKQNCVCAPLGARIVVNWHPQDNKDREFISTTATVSFNPANHKLALVTQHTPAGTPTYILYVDGVFDYCARL